MEAPSWLSEGGPLKNISWVLSQKHWPMNQCFIFENEQMCLLAAHCHAEVQNCPEAAWKMPVSHWLRHVQEGQIPEPCYLLNVDTSVKMFWGSNLRSPISFCHPLRHGQQVVASWRCRQEVTRS